MDTTSNNLLERYYGTKSSVKIDLWLNLFEVIVADQDEKKKIQTLMRYLGGDALNWYATDIVSDLDQLTWAQCKTKLIERFGEPVVHPIIEAQRRYLTRIDTVQTYFDEKMRLLRRCSLTDAAIIAMLNEGMPIDYRNILIGSMVKTSV